MTSKVIKVDTHAIEVNDPDKPFFPDGVTKGDLVEYYRRIADLMLPHMRGRPVTMHRFPEGIGSPGFYHKEVPDYFPDWIQRVEIKVEGEGKMQPQFTCENAETLVYIAELGCITPHIWLSRVDRLRYPDKLIFDLDPPAGDFALVRRTALNLRALLDEMDLTTFVMTTGSRGLHVVVPLDREAEFDEVRAFARKVVEDLAARYPDELTTAVRKDQRGNRLFLDYLRNSYAQNSVAPYAVRAKPGAPVATPLGWEELQSLNSKSYSMHNIFRRMGQKEDPWKEMMDHQQSIRRATSKLVS